jgi:serine/threonine protein kinase
VDRLAVGGMAEVFVAVAQGAEGFEKPVVIKRLLPELARMQRFQQMFLDEARIMLSLQHGNIVQILDMGRMEGVPFLTIEYVHGKDLRTILRRAQDSSIQLPHPLAAYIVGEVCRALDYAHRKTDDEGRPLNIVHRDVNPANILVSHEGEVKVSDFGLAKARDNLEQSDSGIIKGKLSYLSPEQALGKEVDNRSDIFSLGTTLYEMTCGKRPFEAATDAAVVIKVREGTFPSPSEVVPGFSPELEAVILRAMRRDPAERYQTANQMRDDIGRYLQTLPVQPSDRELMEFVNGLFPERRSNSSLFRLTPIAHLPPPMTSVSRADGISEFQHAKSPSPAIPIPLGLEPPLNGIGSGGEPTHAPTGPLRPGGGRPPPLPPVAGPPAGPPRTAAAGVLLTGPSLPPRPRAAPAPPAAAGSTSARSGRGGLWAGIALIILAALGGAGYLIFEQLRPAPLAASLSVTSSPPGATVLLDGVETGQRTPAVLLNLARDREYQVSVRHLGGSDQRRFRFDRGGPHAFHFELGPGKETLTVQSEPEGCDVLVDGELRGQTPLTLSLARGRKFAVELRRNGYLAKLVKHYAEHEKDTLRLVLEPEPRPKVVRPRPAGPAVGKTVLPGPRGGVGTLEILTGVRAEVFIDDRLAGHTPGFRRSLPAGSYRVVVVPEGVKIRHAATITVVAGQTHQLRLTSTPTP